MTKSNPIAAQSCGILFFLSVMTDFILAPPNFSGTAQSVIPAVLCCTVLWSLLLPILLSAPCSVHADKSLCALYAAIFIFAASSALLQAVRFYTAVSDVPLPQSILFALLLVAALFAANAGWAALGRAAQLVLLLFLLSLLFLFLGNVGEFRVTNLDFVHHLPQKILADSVTICVFPVEILLFTMPNTAQDAMKKVVLQKAVWLTGGALALLLLCTELRMGTFDAARPTHILARMGGVSIFKRTDALHVSAWIFAALMRIAALLYGATTMLSAFLPQKKSRICFALITLLVVLSACIAASLPRLWQRNIISIATVGALLLALCGRNRRKAKCVNNE
ncbi:MAG: GerAB/ArcD/ProY family transporter [Ruthenibacterium sp.]